MGEAKVTHEPHGLADAVRAAIHRKAENERHPISIKGEAQDWMIDLRPAFLDPAFLAACAKEFWDRLPIEGAVQIAGLETAAIPLMIGLLINSPPDKSSSTGLIIRKERKETGRGRNVEGRLTDAPVIIVDDIFNSGASAEKARASLERIGLTVRCIFTIVDFGAPAGKSWQKKTGIEVISLYRLRDLGLALQERDSTSLQNLYSEPAWSYIPESANPYYVVPKSAPLLVDDRLIFGTDAGEMLCLDAETGKKIWRFVARGVHRKGIWSSPAHFDQKIYFGAYNGNVYCLDLISGDPIWIHPCCEWIGSSPCVVPTNGLLYIGLEYERPRAKGSIVALNLATGDKVWEHWLENYQHGSGGYWAAGDLVIFGTSEHDIRALKGKSGEEVWRFPTQRSPKYLPAIDDGRALVCFACNDGCLYILNLKDGSEYDRVYTDDILYTQPLIYDGKIFFGSGDRHLYIYDIDQRKTVLRLNCEARIYCSPRVIEGTRIIFGTNGGMVYEIDAETYDTISRIAVPDAVTNAIAMSEDSRKIFVSTYMNEIYCFNRIA